MSPKKFRTIIGALAVFMVALVTGVAVGKLYVDSIPTNVVMNMTEAELRDSDADVLKLVKKSKSSKPDSFSAIELYQIAEYNFNQKDAFYKTSDGKAYNALGAQTLHSTKTYRDGEFVWDNISPGLADIKTRVRYTVGSDYVYRHTNGKPENGKLVCDWNSKGAESYTIKEYEKKFNAGPLSSITYVISSKTCPKDAVTKVSKTSDGNYTFKIKLSGTYLTAAAVHYSYEIFYTSWGQLSGEARSKTILPAWEKMEMTVVVDENFDFVSISYDEDYKVYTFAGWQGVNDVFTERFYFGADVPALEEVL